MKAELILSLIVVGLTNSNPIDDVNFDLDSETVVYPRFISFPDGDGNPHVVDLEDEIDHEYIAEISRNPADNSYILYTRRNRNNGQIIVINDAASVRNSFFDANKQTVVVAHGWMSKGKSEPNPSVTAAYLNKHDVNVINVDWSRLANRNYISAVNGVPTVGRAVGQMINWLHSQFGLRYDNVHLIGFSLGAHLVGNAGRETGGRVARVTGLDPAGPLWGTNRERLAATDGVYVEAIHTDGGYTVGGLGIGSSVAQVDFFPNGGISQPGCLTNVCNHARSWEFFAATVAYDHLEGRLCRGSLQVTLNRCSGVALKMGNDDLRKTGTPGKYRLDTRRRYPF